MKWYSARASVRSAEFIGWIKYIALVLAFIGLWQMLSGGMTLLDRWT